MLEKVITFLTEVEGKKNKPYTDTVGKLSIGIGRNLDDVGLSDDEINYLLNNDIKITISELTKIFNYFESYPEPIKVVLISMMFNLGSNRFRKFKNFIQAIKDKDYCKAIKETRDSKRYERLKQRVDKEIELIKQVI